MFSRTDIHIFRDGARRILFDVEGLRFFEIDEVTEAVIDACEGCTSQEVVGTLSGRYAAEDVEAVLEEMEAAGIITDGALSLPVLEATEALMAPTAPVNVTLHVSHACNLKCVYCFADGGAYGGKAVHMKPEVARQAVDWVLDRCRAAGRSHINFFGGEPLLNFPLIREIIQYARERAEALGVQITFGITTNGTLLSEEIVRFLAGEDVQVMISVDGPRQDAHGLRPFHDGRGSYGAVAEGAKRMMAARPENVTLRATLTSCHMDLAGTSRDLSELGESAQVLVGTLNETPDKPWAIRAEHVPSMRTHLREMRDYCVERLVNEECPPKLGQFEDMARQLLKRSRAHFGCSGGRKMMSISVDGSIHFCSSLSGREEFKLGDVFSGLDSERQQGFKERLYIGNRAECQTCWARHLCGGGCAHDALLATGDPFTPNPVSCDLRRHSYELAMGMCIELQERSEGLVERRFLYDEVPAGEAAVA